MGWFSTPRPSQHEREAAELKARYERVVRPWMDAAEVARYVSVLFKALEYELSEPMRRALEELLAAEESFGPTPDFLAMDFREHRTIRHQLDAWERKNVDGGELARDLLIGLFSTLAEELPRVSDPSPFTIPFIYALPDPKGFISSLYKTLWDEKYLEREMFADLRTRMYLNLCYHSGIEPYTEPSKRFRHAVSSDLPLDQVNDTYLKGTPLHALFKSPVPLKLTQEDRFNHMHVIGGTGAGKTTLIENLILHDLRSDDPPSLVVIDPHSDLIRKLTRADLGIEDRLIIIDPRDTKHPVALNPFAINRDRLQTYDETTQEQVTAGVIQTFDYLFSNLFALSLTGKQQTFFRYVTRLLLTLPQVEGRNATILDMLRLIQDPAPYQNAISQLPEISREFFTRDFAGKTYADTKDQVRYRIQAIIENPTLARLFTAPETKVDFFTELNRGAVILIDTAEDFLKDGSAVFGKLMVALLLQAIQERAATHPSRRKPTFLLIDEAADLFSSNIDDLLTDARKYRCGLVLAHQYLDQAAPSLKASLAANTGIKFASGLSAGDARAMAPEMRTTPDFILSQPKLQFAAHIRNVTPQAVSIPISPIRDLPQLSQDAYAALMEKNRERVSLKPQAPKPRPLEPDDEWV